MRKNRSRLASKKGLSKPMHKPNDLQVSLYIKNIGKNHSRLTMKIGLSNHKRNLKDF